MPGEILPSNLSNGRALWGIHSLWARALDEWLSKNGASDPPIERWPAVEFDKLAHLTHLIWNALKKRRLVTFISPYESADGIHGPGPALPLRPWGYWHALKAINHIQEKFRENPDAVIFDLGKQGVKPGRPKAYMPIQASELLPMPYQEKDLHYIKETATLLGQLNMKEIRILGTHQTKAGTLNAIEYNAFIHLGLGFFAEVDNIQSNRLMKKDGDVASESELPPLTQAIDEICRKSDGNREAYETAYRKLADASRNGNEVAQIALSDVFQAPDKVWDREVTRWRGLVGVFVDCHSYLVALNSACRPAEPESEPEARRRQIERLAKERAEGIDAHRRIVENHGVVLPKIPAARTNGFGWVDLQQGLAHLLKRLPGSSNYRGELGRQLTARLGAETWA